MGIHSFVEFKLERILGIALSLEYSSQLLTQAFKISVPPFVDFKFAQKKTKQKNFNQLKNTATQKWETITVVNVLASTSFANQRILAPIGMLLFPFLH